MGFSQKFIYIYNICINFPLIKHEILKKKWCELLETGQRSVRRVNKTYNIVSVGGLPGRYII